MNDLERARLEPPAMADDGGIDWEEYARRLEEAIDDHRLEDAIVRDECAKAVDRCEKTIARLREDYDNLLRQKIEAVPLSETSARMLDLREVAQAWLELHSRQHTPAELFDLGERTLNVLGRR